MLFTVLYYILVVAVVTVFLVLTVLVFPLTVPFDKKRRTVHWLSRVLSKFFFVTPVAWKTRVRGLGHVDKRQTYVIVLNHTSIVDIPMLYWVPLNFRWVSRIEIAKVPFIGQFLLLHGDILIKPSEARAAAHKVLEQGKKWLGRGVCVAMFPEGTRSGAGELIKFKSGAFGLAKEAGVAILPVVLNGSKLIGKGGRLPWKHTFTVQVLEPVSAAEVAARDPKDVMNETRDRMEAARKAIVAEREAEEKRG